LVLNFELSVIKAMLSHDTWLSYKDKLSVKDLPKTIAPLYSILDNFHQQHAVDLSVADLANLVLSVQHKDPDYYKEVLQQLEALSVSDTTTEVLMQSYYEQRLLKEISLSAYEVTEGRAKKDDFLKLVQQFSEGQNQPIHAEEFEFVTDDVEQLLQDTYRKPGLRWRLNTLNKMLGSLRGGDFGFIFARPETGKTTFLASETTFMASQLTEDAGPIIWFNNEEANKKVRIRCFQATLGATLAQINSNPTAARAAFQKATHNKHMLLNHAGSISRQLVERVVRQYRPSLVIFDQIDKLSGFDADREDLKMGAIYQWGRELAKEYNHATIGVCQADGSGEGQKWLTMANVANAKTAKQAEADWILGIGKVADVGFESLRFLHASKNKLSGDEDSDPAMRHGRQEVLIDPTIARYLDIK
jgi:replicative DNA helicase